MSKMSKVRKLLVFAVFAILVMVKPGSAFASTEYTTPDGNFKYTLDNYAGECTIEKYLGTDTAVTIPNKIDSCKVVAVGVGAFRDNKNITTVNLPSTIKLVDESAFNGCTSLATVNGLGKVKTINAYAFKNTAITSADLSGLDSCVGSSSFEHCTNLQKVTLGKKVTVIGSGAFASCNALVSVDTSKVKEFGSGAFYGCESLKSVSFSKAVSIGDSAFLGSGLKSVSLPKTVQTLDPSCFAYCMSLENVVLNVAKNVSYGAGNLRNDCQCWTFAGCKNLKTVKIGNHVDELGYNMFADTGIKTIVIPSNVKIIDGTTFSNCSELSKMYFTGLYASELGVDAGSRVVIYGGKNSTIQKLAKSYEVKFVALKRVESLKAKSPKKKNVKLTWKKMSGVKSYVIYRSPRIDNGYVKIGTTTKTSFVDKKVKSGKKYYYNIAITYNDGTVVLNSVMGKPVKVKVK